MESVASISAYIPCYNNAGTLEAAIIGIQGQAVKVDELFVVDDGSIDASREVAAALQVRVIEMKVNQGRGAVRARAMEEARHELVLCCDATNRLREDFLEGALPRFTDLKVAGVCGRLMDLNVSGALGRWRARHLFRQDAPSTFRRDNLSTWGTLMRKSSVMKAGNFNSKLRFGEDYELGRRLMDAGYEILFDPSLIVATQVRNTLAQTMERFFRWHWDGSRQLTPHNFMRAQALALKALAPEDLRDGDPAAALISLLTPYYQLIYYYNLKKMPPETIMQLASGQGGKSR
jgi:cellulose synthase/poly-beta-1,6-N-acetylglucosamine synthase-like glycosyltransferase